MNELEVFQIIQTKIFANYYCIEYKIVKFAISHIYCMN
jgi:hypothetical protein